MRIIRKRSGSMSAWPWFPLVTEQTTTLSPRCNAACERTETTDLHIIGVCSDRQYPHDRSSLHRKKAYHGSEGSAMMNGMAGTSIALFGICSPARFSRRTSDSAFPSSRWYSSARSSLLHRGSHLPGRGHGEHLYLTIAWRKHINWHMMGPLLLVSLVTGVVVAMTSRRFDQKTLELLLGGALLLISNLVGDLQRAHPHQATNASGAAMGWSRASATDCSHGRPAGRRLHAQRLERKETYMDPSSVTF
jgi:hypothetical protein